jgi:hypothetical protein
MNDAERKSFDCVKFMRTERDKISAEIAEMSHEELVRWLRDHEYEDEGLDRLAKRAAAKADEADRPSPRR